MERRMVDIFKNNTDPRVGNAKKHKLDEILTIAILAIISECTQFTKMELFGKEREAWSRGFLSLENGIPSHNMFGDVFFSHQTGGIAYRFYGMGRNCPAKDNDEVVVVGKDACETIHVDFAEDPMRIRAGYAAENMNIMRYLTLNRLKSETSFCGSMNLKRK